MFISEQMFFFSCFNIYQSTTATVIQWKGCHVTCLDKKLDFLGRLHLLGCIPMHVKQIYIAGGCKICRFRLIWMFTTVSCSWDKGITLCSKNLFLFIIYFTSIKWHVTFANLNETSLLLGRHMVWKASEDDSYVRYRLSRRRTLRLLFSGM